MRFKIIYREGVCCIGFTVDQKKVVLIKRRDLSVWYLPGGGMNLDETPEDAAEREFGEETGLKIKIDCYHGEYDFKIPRKWPVFYDKQYVYSGIVIGGRLTVNPEAEAVELFEIGQFPRGFPSFHRERVYEAKKRRVNRTPVVQTWIWSDVLENIHVVKKLPTFIKKMTISSPKRQ